MKLHVLNVSSPKIMYVSGPQAGLAKIHTYIDRSRNTCTPALYTYIYIPRRVYTRSMYVCMYVLGSMILNHSSIAGEMVRHVFWKQRMGVLALLPTHVTETHIHTPRREGTMRRGTLVLYGVQYKSIRPRRRPLTQQTQ